MSSGADSVLHESEITIIEKFLSCHVTQHVEVRSPTSGAKISCWTYITQGFGKKKHRELLLTVTAATNENNNQPAQDLIPKQPTEVLEKLFEAVSNGKSFREGDIFEYTNSNGFLGNPSIAGFVFVFSQPLKGVVFPSEPVLAMLSITKVELRLSKDYGVTRLLSMIGNQNKYYPFPPWIDPDRPSVIDPSSDYPSSSISSCAKLQLPDACVHVEGKLVTMRIPGVCLTPLMDLLNKTPETLPVCLLLGWNHGADGHFFWTLKVNQKPQAITPPGSTGVKLGGSYVSFIPGQRLDRVIVHEDGFVVMLTSMSWHAMRQYFPTKKGLKVQSDVSDALDFEIFWHELEYVNPIDGSVYGTHKGWFLNDEITPVEDFVKKGQTSDRNISLDEVLLMTNNEEIKKNLSLSVLSNFISATASIIETTYIKTIWPCDFKMSVQITFGPKGLFDVTLVTDPPNQIKDLEIQELMTNVRSLQVPDTKDEIKFLLHFKCKKAEDL